MSTANDAYTSLFGPSGETFQYETAGRPDTISSVTGLHHNDTTMPLSSMFGVDPGNYHVTGHVTVVTCDTTLNPPVHESHYPIERPCDAAPLRFDFRDEIITLLYDPTQSFDTLSRMIVVLDAVSKGTMFMNHKYVASRNNAFPHNGGVPFFQNNIAATCRKWYNALCRIYTNVKRGETGVLYPTVTFMRQAGQEWNMGGAFGTRWVWTAKGVLAEHMKQAMIRQLKDELPEMMFLRPREFMFRVAAKLHHCIYTSYSANPSNATLSFNIPSTRGGVECGRVGSSVIGQYISAKVLELLSDRLSPERLGH